MSLYLSIGKVALHRDKVYPLIIAGSDDHVVELIGFVLLRSREIQVTDADATLGIVYTVGSEVGIEFCRQYRRAELL